MNTGLDLLRHYLDDSTTDTEKRTDVYKAILQTTGVSVRGMTVEEARSYCYAVTLSAVNRLRTRDIPAAEGTTTHAVTQLSRRQDIKSQLPLDLLWAAWRVAVPPHRRSEADARITTAEKPDTLEQLERYIRDYLATLNS